ncbi:MAG: hypothetical protein GYA51_18750 [Candidatus Methanofastidiosa archaeon]|nr:hypothetical protein [Candidatus Methanofastidiosa archaeon]
MNERRYILEPYKGMNTRYCCPSCQQKEKTFSRYIDTQTGEYIAATVGRCNRESNCGYHYTPKQYFLDNNINTFRSGDSIVTKPQQHQQKPISFIPVETFKRSLEGYESNFFIDFLISVFDTEITTQMISKYFIGTSKYWQGATVFWQLDIAGKVRTGKIMLYDMVTGKRVKEPFNHITWVHKALGTASFELKQCFFGEHLLIDKSRSVAIVESEKTAIISSVFFPQFIWLASGSVNNLTISKCQVLTGRKVILFPDLNGYEKWNEKVKELSHLADVTISDLLENKASEAEHEQGCDLADYLIRINYKDFVNYKTPDPPPEIQTPLKLSRKIDETEQVWIKTNHKRADNWDKEILELEQFFYTTLLPSHPISIKPHETILDVNKTVESLFTTIKQNNGKKGYLPYLEQLKEIRGYFMSSADKVWQT